MSRPDASRWGDETIVITGGSQGIGLALATELAGRCRTLTLIARDTDKLRRAAETLQCDYVSADVCNQQALALPALAQCSMLICCAGEITLDPKGILALGKSESGPHRTEARG